MSRARKGTAPRERQSPRKLRPPSAADVSSARAKAGHTQAEAAAYVHSTARRWREWEAGDHTMAPGLFELYLLRTQAIIMVEPADLARLIVGQEQAEK